MREHLIQQYQLLKNAEIPTDQLTEILLAITEREILEETMSNETCRQVFELLNVAQISFVLRSQTITFELDRQES
ncbi:hypothetical protein [Sulfoacidibacillus thermotolerans]|uniref:Uncharacterized protein n=1 Tax=Sulfoacidibacillus thermotolerans TaxID=1765684 RepID=A0A2U3D5Q4_SULT2|nr:hypothetical protein [Sulfoacidibacillus thermotolerans]PWI56597.1 hypothetical protein BM613_12915 [Sulfoacidibacillus thermotolerans]